MNAFTYTYMLPFCFGQDAWKNRKQGEDYFNGLDEDYIEVGIPMEVGRAMVYIPKEVSSWKVFWCSNVNPLLFSKHRISMVFCFSETRMRYQLKRQGLPSLLWRKRKSEYNHAWRKVVYCYNYAWALHLGYFFFITPWGRRKQDKIMILLS